jgi:hypothetical protein
MRRLAPIPRNETGVPYYSRKRKHTLVELLRCTRSSARKYACNTAEATRKYRHIQLATPTPYARTPDAVAQLALPSSKSGLDMAINASAHLDHVATELHQKIKVTSICYHLPQS